MYVEDVACSASQVAVLERSAGVGARSEVGVGQLAAAESVADAVATWRIAGLAAQRAGQPVAVADVGLGHS